MNIDWQFKDHSKLLIPTFIIFLCAIILPACKDTPSTPSHTSNPRVTSPFSGDIVYAGLYMAITWSGYTASEVNIYLYKGSSSVESWMGIKNTYSQTVLGVNTNDSLAAGTDYRVRIKGFDTAEDAYSAYFTVMK